MHECYHRYLDLYWAAPCSSATEAACEDILIVLEDVGNPLVRTQLANAREALVSAQFHDDHGAISYYQEKIAVYEQFLQDYATVQA